MVGITTMSSSVAPLKESPAFINAITMFANPIVGILVGAHFDVVGVACQRSGSGAVEALHID